MMNQAKNSVPLSPQQGEVWAVRFDPSEGDEIRKLRPAIVMNVPSAGRMQLRMVIPITGWQEMFTRYFWMVKLNPSTDNGLSKQSAADCFQLKSVSTNRFGRQMGRITSATLEEIQMAIALCIGYINP